MRRRAGRSRPAVSKSASTGWSTRTSVGRGVYTRSYEPSGRSDCPWRSPRTGEIAHLVVHPVASCAAVTKGGGRPCSARGHRLRGFDPAPGPVGEGSGRVIPCRWGAGLGGRRLVDLARIRGLRAGVTHGPRMCGRPSGLRTAAVVCAVLAAGLLLPTSLRGHQTLPDLHRSNISAGLSPMAITEPLPTRAGKNSFGTCT